MNKHDRIDQIVSRSFLAAYGEKMIDIAEPAVEQWQHDLIEALDERDVVREKLLDNLWRFCWVERMCLREGAFDLWVKAGQEISDTLDALGEPQPWKESAK